MIKRAYCLIRGLWQSMHLFAILIFFSMNIISTSQSQEINLILAVDTSGSTSIGNYLSSVSEGIKLFLIDLNKTTPRVNVGLVSWDDNIDFIIEPNLDHKRSSKFLGKLSSSSIEEGTDFKQAMIGAKMATNDLDCCYFKNVIIIITEESEYYPSDYYLDETKYIINSLYIKDDMVESSLPVFVYLRNLTNEYNGTVSTAPMDSRAIAQILHNIVLDNVIKADLETSESAYRAKINNSIINKLIANMTNTERLCIPNRIVEDNLILNTNINKSLIFYNCIFKGSVSIANSSFKKSVEFNKCYFKKDAACNIYNSYFFSPVIFNDSIFDSPVDISNSVFSDRCSFQNTRFNSLAKFEKLIFKENATFTSAHFGDNVSFNSSKFNNFADFNNYYSVISSFDRTNFSGPVSFKGSNFKDSVDFRSVSFDSSADFSNTYHLGISSFDKTTFSGPVSFEDSDFAESSFCLSEFDNNATFMGANFYKNASFRSAIFDQSVGFRNSNFMDLADFGLATFNGSADFEYSNFKGTLELTKAKINYLENFNWPYFINKIKCDDQLTFSELIRNFRNLRNFEAANEMYFQYCELEKNRLDWLDLSKWIYILAFYTCGYGVKPLYTIGLGIYILFFFGMLFFALMIYKRNDKVFSFGELIDCLSFSSILLLSVPRDLYPARDDTYDIILYNIKSTTFIRYLPIIERLIGWGLMLLLINTLTRVMINY
jgi:hypothetical protein